jgi:hypothetical protein
MRDLTPEHIARGVDVRLSGRRDMEHPHRIGDRGERISELVR